MVSKEKIMKKSIIAIMVSSTFLLTPHVVFAQHNIIVKQQTSHKEQNSEELGFGTGAIVGGVLAGPVGAFVTGLVVSLFVKNSNSKENVQHLKTALVAQKSTNKTNVTKFQQQLQNVEQNYQHELLTLQQSYQASGQLQAENLLMSLQFSTGSSDIAVIYQPQIQALAKILQQSPQIIIDLSGYTDLQGSEQLNQTLSQARVNAVKLALVDYGIDDTRINTQAYGESAPVIAKSDKEVSFYDRRVVIKLHSNNNQTAKN
jgi:sortase system peptidoglycan-associated protein